MSTNKIYVRAKKHPDQNVESRAPKMWDVSQCITVSGEWIDCGDQMVARCIDRMIALGDIEIVSDINELHLLEEK